MCSLLAVAGSLPLLNWHPAPWRKKNDPVEEKRRNNVLHEVHSDFVRKTYFCKRSSREKERKQEWEVGTKHSISCKSRERGAQPFHNKGLDHSSSTYFLYVKQGLWDLLCVWKVLLVMENPGIYYVLSCTRSWKRQRCFFNSTLLLQGKENAYVPNNLGSFLASLRWHQLNGIMYTSLGFLNTFKFLVRLVLLHNMLARASLGKRVGRKLLSEADMREVVPEVPCL